MTKDEKPVHEEGEECKKPIEINLKKALILIFIITIVLVTMVGVTRSIKQKKAEDRARKSGTEEIIVIGPCP